MTKERLLKNYELYCQICEGEIDEPRYHSMSDDKFKALTSIRSKMYEQGGRNLKMVHCSTYLFSVGYIVKTEDRTVFHYITKYNHYTLEV